MTTTQPVTTVQAHRIGATLPSKFQGFCLLCDQVTQPGQMVGMVKRFGWVHVTCAEQGSQPPTATAECGAPTKAGHPCRMATAPGGRCRFHGGA
jgi:hypothetical protein